MSFAKLPRGSPDYRHPPVLLSIHAIYSPTMTRQLSLVAAAAVVLGAGLAAQNGATPASRPPAAAAANGAATNPRDWPTVGNDPGGGKYSALTQITPANVTQLTRAWT